MDGITQEHLDALYFYAKANGRTWKSKLLECWITGNYGGFEHDYLLQQIRNRVEPRLRKSLFNTIIIRSK